MNFDATETLYVKQGRKYKPVGTAVRFSHDYQDIMKAGTWRLVYCPKDGAGRYWYGVNPDCASWSAAAMMAENAMIEAINKVSYASMDAGVKLRMTKKQRAAADEARKILMEAGLLQPIWWKHSSAYEIAKAGLDAVRDWGRSKE
jgi:hypothetical protein